MTTDPHDLAGAYVLDALDADERAAFEAHLASCAECRAEVAEHAEVVAAIAESDAVAPPAHLRDAVLAGIVDVVQERPALRSVSATPASTSSTSSPSSVASSGAGKRRSYVTGMLAAAAAVVAIVVGAFVVLGDDDTAFDTVADADDAIVVQLEGEAGTLAVAYSAALDRVALRGEGVEDLDDDQRYALWAIADDTPIPAGLFEPDDGSIDGVVELADVRAEAWGVTIESAAGADAPTGEILYFADV